MQALHRQTVQDTMAGSNKFIHSNQFLTLAGGESGPPGVAPHTHHQRISHQAVAFITLELQGPSRVQVVFLYFAVQHLFWAVTAFGC